jgi:hypothetical protein
MYVSIYFKYLVWHFIPCLEMEKMKKIYKIISMLFSVNVENGNPIHPPSPQNQVMLQHSNLILLQCCNIRAQWIVATKSKRNKNNVVEVGVELMSSLFLQCNTSTVSLSQYLHKFILCDLTKSTLLLNRFGLSRYCKTLVLHHLSFY